MWISQWLRSRSVKVTGGWGRSSQVSGKLVASLVACEARETMCVTALERNMHFFVKHILTQLVDKVPDEAWAIFMGCQPSLKVNLVVNKEDGIYLGLIKIPISENRFKCFFFFFLKGILRIL